VSPLGEAFVRICEMTDARLSGMSPPDRDRLLQYHLAAARGSRRNFELLCRLTDEFAPIRRELILQERPL
jgi:hypothetical protein